MKEKDYFKEERISSSSLKWFEESPLYFKKMLTKEIKEANKIWFDRGRQIHMFVLEPKKFNENYVFLQYETPTSAQQKKFCEEYIKSSIKVEPNKQLIHAYTNSYTIKNESDEKVLQKANVLLFKLAQYIKYLQESKKYKAVISWINRQMLFDVQKSIILHKKASELIIDDPFKKLSNPDLITMNELEIYWEYNKLKCKSMLDRVIIDKKNKIVTLIDLKTADKLKNFSDRIKDLNYDRQLIFYWLALLYYAKKEMDIDLTTYKHRTYIVTTK